MLGANFCRYSRWEVSNRNWLTGSVYIIVGVICTWLPKNWVSFFNVAISFWWIFGTSGFGQLKATNDEADTSKWHMNLKSTQPNISTITFFLSKTLNPPDFERTKMATGAPWQPRWRRRHSNKPKLKRHRRNEARRNSVVLGGSSHLHPGGLTWNLQITYLERKMIFQTSMIMVHVNLPGCSTRGV